MAGAELRKSGLQVHVVAACESDFDSPHTLGCILERNMF